MPMLRESQVRDCRSLSKAWQQPLDQGIISQEPVQVRAETHAGMLRRVREGRAGNLVSLNLIAMMQHRNGDRQAA